MIASVSGEVLTRRPDCVVLQAAGVGYRLAVSETTLRQVPPVGQQVTLLSQLIARDDGLLLYGFASEQERELFQALLGVQSVGPKIALQVLSGGTPRDLVAALAAGDTGRFQAVPGIGKRTAERIVVELRERVAGVAAETASSGDSESGEPEPTLLAREALTGLGYSPQEAIKLLEQAQGTRVEDLVASALRSATSKEGAR